MATHFEYWKKIYLNEYPMEVFTFNDRFFEELENES